MIYISITNTTVGAASLQKALHLLCDLKSRYQLKTVQWNTLPNLNTEIQEKGLCGL